METSISSILDSATIRLYNASADVSGAGNFMISPINILHTAMLVYIGTSGQTKSELDSALKFNAESTMMDSLVLKFGDNLRQLSSRPDQDYKLQVANGVFIQNGLSVKKAYQRSVVEKLQSRLAWKNFSIDAQGSREDINKWISEKTNGKINELILPAAINEMTKMVLTSAIYFKAPWKNVFDEVVKDTFTMLDGMQESVDFMMAGNRYKYTDDAALGVQYLEIPYLNSPVSFLLLLPKKKGDLRRVESLLKEDTLSGLASQAKVERVHLSMPKFRLETGLDLKAVLVKLGVQSVFSEEADLSGISAKSKLYVSDAFHKTFIDVNENGTEAAGASFMTIMPVSLVTWIQFKANHPFMFAIRHDPTNTILFIGRIENV